ncbi:MAG: DUF983 domain-containing protein [Cyclobacteriaceae bacterium]
MPEKPLLNALLKGKCPRCREGQMFAYPLARLSKFIVMNNACPHCGVRLEPEPGFYQGAMYVGYGFTVMTMLVIGLSLYFIADPSTGVYIGTVIGVMLLLVPLNYRYSRILYLYLFGGIKYDPSLSS